MDRAFIFILYGSLPARGAWIEINSLHLLTILSAVAPREGSVDWNGDVKMAEDAQEESLPARGAWIEIRKTGRHSSHSWSLPARGAWIEILYCCHIISFHLPSLPARGAWIEILPAEGGCAG